MRPAIKNIIFDLGHVILSIDFDKTIAAFQKLGFNDFDVSLDGNRKIFDDLEIGKATPKEFIAYFQKINPDVTPTQIIDAWNALLLEVKADTIDILKTLKSHYRLFLYSNTNAIHIEWFNQYMADKHQLDDWADELFDEVYFSHTLGYRKPNPEGFESILENQSLRPDETLFIDDFLPSVAAAMRLGIHGLHKPAGADLRESLLRNGLLED